MPIERYRNLSPDDPTGGGQPQVPGLPAPTAPAPWSPVPKPAAPTWKTDLWNKYKSEGKPGDWQAYWRSHRTGAAPAGPTAGLPPAVPQSAPQMPALNPTVPQGQPATPEQMLPALGMPTPDYGMPYQQSMPGDFNDPYNAYLSAIPVMETIRDKEISDAMAKAGFGGNRYSTSAMNTAGQIGAQTSQQLNQMLNQTMYNQAQSDLDRALQASGMGMQLGMNQDELARNRLNELFGYGQYEQNRQDQYAQQAYQDFINSRMGYLPLLAQVLGGVGAPTPGQAVQTVTNPGTPPKIPPEILPFLLQFFS